MFFIGEVLEANLFFSAYYNKAQRGKHHPEVNEGLILNTGLDIDGQV